MALLTAEDVLNKAFSKTKYREGFDQDEVDDFLDEVANTIAQLTAERDELAARVANGVPAAAAEAPPVTSAGGVPGTSGLLAAATEPGGANPTGMLAMAQKLHDEYVQAGEAERDRIIDEANVAADQIRERADGDAKTRMDELAGERSEIEGRIDDLRRFERDYRARLKSYLENLLGDLDHAAGGGAAAAAGFAAMPGGDEPAVEAPAADVTPEPEAAAPSEDWPTAVEAPAADAAVTDEAAAEEPAAQEPAAKEPAAAQTAPADTAAPSAWGPDAAPSAFGEAPANEPTAGSEFEPAPVSFDEALSGTTPAAPDAGAGQAEPYGAPQSAFGSEPGSAPDVAPAAPAQDDVPAAPSYDSTQSWESQLQPQRESSFSNPFAPVTEPAPSEQAAPAADATPALDGEDDANAAKEEPPFTPPSSRMFSDLYGQQRPESEN